MSRTLNEQGMQYDGPHYEYLSVSIYLVHSVYSMCFWYMPLSLWWLEILFSSIFRQSGALMIVQCRPSTIDIKKLMHDNCHIEYQIAYVSWKDQHGDNNHKLEHFSSFYLFHCTSTITKSIWSTLVLATVLIQNPICQLSNLNSIANALCGTKKKHEHSGCDEL